jgi:hypothetical protein
MRMMSQRDLARAFENGATGGRASNVEIRAPADGHALVDTRGRGAVLAYRYPSGEIVAFEGWYGYSVSTSVMLTKMGLSYVCRHDDDCVYRANASSADAPTVRGADAWTVVGERGGADCTLHEWLDTHDPTHIGSPHARE